MPAPVRSSRLWQRKSRVPEMREQETGAKAFGVCGIGQGQLRVTLAHACRSMRIVRQPRWPRLVRVEKLSSPVRSGVNERNRLWLWKSHSLETYTITVTGTSGNITQKGTVSLTVQ